MVLAASVKMGSVREERNVREFLRHSTKVVQYKFLVRSGLKVQVHGDEFIPDLCG